MRRIHPTVDLVSPWGETIPVDEEIARNIADLWEVGIHTFFSCQGYRPDDPRLDGRRLGQHTRMRGYVTLTAGQAECAVRYVLPTTWVTQIEEPHQLLSLGFLTQTVRFLRL